MKNEDKSDEISAKPLASVIKEFVDDIRLKTSATRATWLGNDETHFVKKWADKDLKDLKMLIELTIHWIKMEELTNQIAIDMPEKK